MKAMILAAGRGERLRPLTDTLPKPLVSVAGKPLIVYHLEKLAEIGVKDVVINHAWLGHKLPEMLGDGHQWGLNIQYSEEGDALETAGGIKRALPLLGTAPFLVINGDIYLDNLPNDLHRAYEHIVQGHGEAFLWLVDNPEHHPQGDFAIDTAARLSLKENEKLTFSGVGIYHPQFFQAVPEGKQALGPLLREAISNQQVMGAYLDTYWCDVGTITRLEQLEARLQA
ncbi:N-acetylmuramate alpha-1-phosphate uridylyltransferase MurU [Shewanella sp.]|uniref:N-acetylmuramate alpha-1-phosphate uridylyltransferase MurU n=1 Tax=Shewanella sp. TaxID=50422 RepID=UPI00404869EC